MKNWMFAAFTLLLFSLNGCSKYTTAKKVERKIINDTWRITSFSIDGESVLENYSGYTFGFDENGGVAVKGTGFSEFGSWEMGLNKNPAILYLSFSPVGGLEYLADDWQVIEMKNDLMKLKRNGDTGSNANITFNK